MRQTVFDWLAPSIGGARCLDLYAGSGALGLEALSRGAASVSFVEREHAAAEAIRGHLSRIGAAGGRVIAGDALATLGSLVALGEAYDVVFLDPPFESNLRRKTLDALVAAHALAPGALVYLEGPADEVPELPAGWTLHRSKRAGNVGYHLLIAPRHADAEPPNS